MFNGYLSSHANKTRYKIIASNYLASSTAVNLLLRERLVLLGTKMRFLTPGPGPLLYPGGFPCKMAIFSSTSGSKICLWGFGATRSFGTLKTGPESLSEDDPLPELSDDEDPLLDIVMDLDLRDPDKTFRTFCGFILMVFVTPFRIIFFFVGDLARTFL